MSKDKDKIIQKIKKLLDLANSEKNSNVEEAAAAAAKAQSLMEKYRIKRAMLHSSEDKTGWKKLEDNGKPDNWKIYLVSAISKYNGCFIVKSESYEKDNVIHMVGEDADIDSVQELYSYIVSQLNQLCIINLIEFRTSFGFYPRNGYTNGFYQGAISTIDSRLSAAKKAARREEMKNATTLQEKENLKNVLTIIDNKHYKAKEWIKKNLNAKMEDIPLENPHPSGYIAGLEAAKNLNIKPNQPKLSD